MNESDIQQMFEVDLLDATPEERYYYAVATKAYDRIAEALDSGVSVDLPRFGHGATALSWAKTEQIARLLLERGADPNAQDWEGVNALSLAVGAGDVGLVRLLLEFCADPLLASPLGTPLEAAREYGSVEILELIEGSVRERQN